MILALSVEHLEIRSRESNRDATLYSCATSYYLCMAVSFELRLLVFLVSIIQTGVKKAFSSELSRITALGEVVGSKFGVADEI